MRCMRFEEKRMALEGTLVLPLYMFREELPDDLS